MCPYFDRLKKTCKFCYDNPPKKIQEYYCETHEWMSCIIFKANDRVEKEKIEELEKFKK